MTIHTQTAGYWCGFCDVFAVRRFAGYSTSPMLVCYLQVVFFCNLWSVAQPLREDMFGYSFANSVRGTTELPLLVGSRVSPENIKETFEYADAAYAR
jgi:hypothetical protein